MKISEAIKQLEILKASHGDLQIKIGQCGYGDPTWNDVIGFNFVFDEIENETWVDVDHE